MWGGGGHSASRQIQNIYTNKKTEFVSLFVCPLMHLASSQNSVGW